MEAATAMIFNSVSWWVLASHGMRRWTLQSPSQTCAEVRLGGATRLCRSRAVSGSGRAVGSRADDGEA